jgi:hypothetical protein
MSGKAWVSSPCDKYQYWASIKFVETEDVEATLPTLFDSITLHEGAMDALASLFFGLTNSHKHLTPHTPAMDARP